MGVNVNEKYVHSYLYVVDDNFFGAVDTDDSVHTARSSSACFPVFQCVLSGT